MSSFFTPLLHLPLLFFIILRVGQIQYRIDNARNRIGGMVLHFMFLFRLSFCNLLRLFRSRIQFVEDIRLELFSQHRPVGNDAVVMVNESHAIDSADRIDAEDSVDVLRLEQLPKLVPCIVRTHSIPDCLSQPVERPVLLQRTFRPLVILLKGFIAYVFPYFARLDGRADAVAVVGQNPRHYLHSFFRRSFRCVPRPRR